MMKVFEAIDENCMKALGQILYEQRAYGDVARAAEITIEIEGKPDETLFSESQKVLHCIQDIIPDDADLIFRMEHNEKQEKRIHLILFIKEEKSVFRKWESIN